MQPAVSQGTLNDAVGTHPPVPLAAARGHVHLFPRNPQGEQMASACPRLFPLLPVVEPHPSPQIRARCVSARPPHLPARLNRMTSRCCARSSYRARPSMRFLFVGPPIFSSLPPHGRLPSRSWLRVVVTSCCHDRSSHKGLAPSKQRAHAGRTHRLAPYFGPRGRGPRTVKAGVGRET
jgi:hypothetical protein